MTFTDSITPFLFSAPLINAHSFASLEAFSSVKSNGSFDAQRCKIFKNDNQFTIEFTHPCKQLILSLVKSKLLSGATIDEDNKSVVFTASCVKTYKQFMDEIKLFNGTSKLCYEFSLKMVASLITQLQYLLNNYMCFYMYNTDNIIVINDITFVYIGCALPSLLENPIDSAIINITNPFSKTNCFVSPELSVIKTLPFKIDHKTIYYSLGLLIIHALSNIDVDVLHNSEHVIDFIKAIKGTKLYWLIFRCLNNDINQRCVLYV